MLAASTIGPGTVIDAQGGLPVRCGLLWALVLASFVAYALQEVRLGYPSAAARRWEVRCASSCKDRYTVAVGILVGNTFTKRTILGAAEALYALGVPRHNPGIQVVIRV